MKSPFGKLKKVKKSLVFMTYSVYCFGHKQGSTNDRRWTYSEFCKNIKEVNTEGAKLWDGKQG